MKNQIIIHSSGKQTRVALLENGELAQLFIESEENQRTVGDIYIARVHKVMSGIRAAFIDVGMEKDAFLHFSDAGDHLGQYIMMLNGENSISNSAKKELKNFNKLSNNDKQILAGKLLKNNQNLLVQIVKEPIGTKGPRVSTDITIAGRFLVLIPMGEYIALSKKINNGRERRRLKSIVGSMLPEGFGVIVRTVAQKQDKEAIEDDMRNILKKWERILNKLEDAKPPTLLYKDLDITESLIRDLFAKDYERVLIDDYQLYKSVKSYVSQIAPKKLPAVQLYKGKDHIFDHTNIGHDVNSIFSPRVRMPSGGYLIFEQTEAMYVVDVNSGPYAAKEKQEDNSLKTNLEAAREVAKQLRLRDIGGIIVVDFIDLRDNKNRKKIYDELKKEFKKDQAKTNVIGMSDFGLVQITRQRIRPSVVNSVSKVCPMCGGTGSVVSQDTIVTDIESWISKFKYSTEYRAVDIYVNPYLRSFLCKGVFSQRWRWMLRYKLKISFIADETISLNEFKSTLAGSDLEITDVVLQDQSLDDIIEAHHQQMQEVESEEQNTLDYYSKDDRNGNGSNNGSNKRSNLPPRPKRQSYG
ncbi:Rne/Rng family ribonuclease [Rhodohalobacter sulfatireducens]|uniref:Rne/Rng family ribonuclease n=1 Tax=Rhodohalobacter sulfatireducens TaxID=2911366 RepID=A0ABS9KDE7_9BACT|nr:Rne/Rng family ribonuclease [Rhodohalobacter sulfatireducens]MCG2588889.1 Rne/Rng family ribonuclease [Rhodohalobacter sulfatireducens]